MKIKDSNRTKDAAGEPGMAEHASIAAALRKEYLKAILTGSRKIALEIIMDAYRGGFTIPAIYMDVFQEALYEIGRLWETKQITVADEHMGTAITQYAMANLYQYLEIADERRGKAVMTGVQGELHQVGASMVADVLEADGWDVMFLGSNVPAQGVIQSIRKHGADLLGISSTMQFNIPQVVELVKAVRKEFGNSVRIMLGGSAFKTPRKLPLELGGCPVAMNLFEAVDQARPDASNQA
jgi:methanogenic corrinoid protein MtbC1